MSESLVALDLHALRRLVAQQDGLPPPFDPMAVGRRGIKRHMKEVRAFFAAEEKREAEEEVAREAKAAARRATRKAPPAARPMKAKAPPVPKSPAARSGQLDLL